MQMPMVESPAAGRRVAAYTLFLAALAWFLYFQGASSAGLIGPDEPRYAQVSREMLRSGD